MSQTSYARLDPAGRITAIGRCNHRVLGAIPVAAGERIVPCDGFKRLDDLTHWHDGQTFAPRPSLPGFDKTLIAADGADKATLAGLPVRCTIFIDGAPHPVDDGRLEISSDMPATYTVEVDHFPYRPFRAQIVAL